MVEELRVGDLVIVRTDALHGWPGFSGTTGPKLLAKTRRPSAPRVVVKVTQISASKDVIEVHKRTGTYVVHRNFLRRFPFVVGSVVRVSNRHMNEHLDPDAYYRIVRVDEFEGIVEDLSGQKLGVDPIYFY